MPLPKVLIFIYGSYKTHNYLRAMRANFQYPVLPTCQEI